MIRTRAHNARGRFWLHGVAANTHSQLMFDVGISRAPGFLCTMCAHANATTETKCLGHHGEQHFRIRMPTLGWLYARQIRPRGGSFAARLRRCCAFSIVPHIGSARTCWSGVRASNVRVITQMCLLDAVRCACNTQTHTHAFVCTLYITFRMWRAQTRLFE